MYVYIYWTFECLIMDLTEKEEFMQEHLVVWVYHYLNVIFTINFYLLS